MSTQDQEHQIAEVLEIHRESMVAAFVQYVISTIPGYKTIPLDQVRAQLRPSMDTLIDSLCRQDTAVLVQFVEELGRRRLQAGIPIEAQLSATQVMREVINRHISPALAHNPATQAAFQRTLDRRQAMVSNILTRVYLGNVTDQK